MQKCRTVGPYRYDTPRCLNMIIIIIIVITTTSIVISTAIIIITIIIVTTIIIIIDTNLQLRDIGEYQCQVNTEPKISLSVFLLVSGQI